MDFALGRSTVQVKQLVPDFVDSGSPVIVKCKARILQNRIAQDRCLVVSFSASCSTFNFLFEESEREQYDARAGRWKM